MTDVWIDWSGDSPDDGSGLVVCNACGFVVGGIEHSYQAAYEQAVLHAMHPEGTHGRRPLTVQPPDYSGVRAPLIPQERSSEARGRGRVMYVPKPEQADEIRRRLLDRERPRRIQADLGVPLQAIHRLRDEVMRGLLADGWSVVQVARRLWSKVAYVEALQN
ncbi:hypothetical protein [Microbacterium sp. No. 7]|uniref:hypothetical protein n=1 Tax=Microbacterium sp. No. 7 TaxID=1714373 RepID=UPI0006D0290E|nr:hypothetical protein [Microbacterium sp. No. 7]ALJ19559.1 hypothetical protein AOA12_06400 [Microbacterium sp. No. 7]